MKFPISLMAAVFTTSLFLAPFSYAGPAPSSRNPETNASDRNYDTNQPESVPGATQKAKDAGNRALNKVDRGVHKAAGKTKRGSERALDKSEDAVDRAMEPAKEPS